MAADLTLLTYAPDSEVASITRKVVLLERNTDELFDKFILEHKMDDANAHDSYQLYNETCEQLDTQMKELYSLLSAGVIDTFSVGADYGGPSPVLALSELFSRRGTVVITTEFISHVMVTLNVKDTGKRKGYKTRRANQRQVKKFLTEQLGKECIAQFW